MLHHSFQALKSSRHDSSMVLYPRYKCSVMTEGSKIRTIRLQKLFVWHIWHETVMIYDTK